ncbi:chromosome partitioning protein ParA [Scytonema sp. UIC 10036]|nr:chromosome partitioning protein ParA [Scytonema sp. UIC 10036]
MSDNNNASANTNDKAQRRLVIITGDKGGVGKSTFARGLLQLYVDKDIKCLAYEADQRNPQVSRHFGNKYGPLVDYIDIFRRGGADRLLITIEKKQDYSNFLLDLPAQSGGFFEEFVKEVAFFETLKDINCRVTMVSVISRVLDSVNVLEKLYHFCQKQVDYVVVKNLFHGEDHKFERYNDSDFRRDHKEILNEIVMPDLFYIPYDFIDVHALTFADAQTHPGSNIAIRARVKFWLAEFEEKVKPLSNLFNLDIPPTPGIYKEMAEATEKLRKEQESQAAKVKERIQESELRSQDESELPEC